MRKICVVVTARPSYSRVKTALKAIDEHPDLELQLVMAASSLLDRYGTTIKYVEEDGFKVAASVFNVLEGENLTAAAKTTGIGIMELSSVFHALEPDVVVTIADRFETMATAIAASYMNIPLAHIQGGEVSGNIDEKVRHAITKLSDIHLVASAKAEERVIKLGENPEKVFKTGCPSLDLAKTVFDNPALDFNPLEKYGGVGGEQINYKNGYIVAMQHPVTTEYDLSRTHIEETLMALSGQELPVFFFWPNVDAGSDGTSKGIRTFREFKKEHTGKFRFFKNMEPHDFLRLLVNAKCLVGNSSAGIRECAYLGVPTVNIGSRQQGRERGANVIDVEYDRSQIKKAIQTHIHKGKSASDPIYGDGEAGGRVAEVLATCDLDIRKMLTY